ncbi:excinuclease ABC subunit UvrC [Candidatus Hepatobacter penaei]|uniref:excinuclease ABC subunit UvrC n=1 Tax=Candidatus Hepatobacter penaei TaxID=1274402 RepID=UPI000699213F|nr:excinuclease ABC subunit UvrC [Candidatus Hepatobacter penaei]
MEKKELKNNSIQGFAYLKQRVTSVPTTPGIYQMKDAGGRTLYVGKAKNLFKRVSSYTQKTRLSVRIQRMVSSVTYLDIIQTRNEAEALLLEVKLIQKHLPPYNVVFRDNKSLPHLCLHHSTWPYLKRVRNTQTLSKKDVLFGPFPSATSVSLTQNALQRAFMLRTCTDHTFQTRTRPCLQYHIKRCSAPCVGKIDRGAYLASVRGVKKVLQGKSGDIQKTLTQTMHNLSAQRRYEEAARVRNRLHALMDIQQTQALFLSNATSTDIIGIRADASAFGFYWLFFRQGQLLGGTFLKAPRQDDASTHIPPTTFWQLLVQFYQKNPLPAQVITPDVPEGAALFKSAMAALGTTDIRPPQNRQERELCDQAITNAQESLTRHHHHMQGIADCLHVLQDHLGLARPISRIDVFDNSHLQGRHAYGAMIVATPEGFKKSAYRRFSFDPTVNTQDDYQMMDHVLTRHFHHISHAPQEAPDLIIIDGGRGHYHQAEKTLARFPHLSISILTIAKGPDRGRWKETFHTAQGVWSLTPDTPLYTYLQRLRDEAHTFAITSHRKRRTKEMITSSFSSLPWVGSKKSKVLRDTFGSMAALRRATCEQIAHLPGFSKILSQKIYEYLKKND